MERAGYNRAVSRGGANRSPFHRTCVDMTNALLRPVLTLALALVAMPALAAGNADDGKIKAYTCTGCHGIPGYKNIYPHYNVPKIHGQNTAYIVAALTAYKNGDRSHPTMRAQGESLSDQDIQDIAAYLSAQETK
jgi:cytochrome c553